MDRVERYLEVVPLPVLMLGPILALAAFLLVPARLRLPMAIAFQMVWLVLGEMLGLGFIQPVAKATGFAGFGLVAVTAWLDPGPKRSLPALAWGYVAIAIYGFVFIWTVIDLGFAFVIRLQWLIMVMAALAVARTVVDERSLIRLGTALVVGLGIAVFIPFSDLLLHPSTAFKYGLRFTPYQCNANHTGVLFALTAPLAAYAALRGKGALKRVLLLGIAAMAMGMGLLTASRSTMVVMLALLAPVGLKLIRQPAVLAALAVFAMGSIFVMFKFMSPGEVPLERLATVETGRVEQGKEYLDLIAERPWFGLLGTEGESYVTETEFQSHSHNGYIETLYQGGIGYALPVFTMVAFTFYCTFLFWKSRRSFTADPVLVNLLIALMVMAYAHGFVNHSLYWPTTSISFIHVTLSTLMLGWARDVKLGADPLPAATWTDDDGDEAGTSEYAAQGEYADYGDDKGDGVHDGGGTREIA